MVDRFLPDLLPSVELRARLRDFETTRRFDFALLRGFRSLWSTSLPSPLLTRPSFSIFLRAALRPALRFFCVGLL
mgnify:CR=1 FL=1